MAKCWIQLELDDSERTYAPGELITGTVVVKVLKPCRCEQLSLRWQWRVQGPGDPEADSTEDLLTLNGQEEWLAGQELRYPFRLEAPSSPLTYHGYLMSVDWYLLAKARVSGFLDTLIDVEVPFSLVSPETRQPAPAASGSDVWHPLELKAPEDTTGKFVIAGVLFLLFCCPMPLFEETPGLFCLLALFGLGGALLYYRRNRRNPSSSRTMGNLWFASAIVAPGASTGLRLHVRPESPLREHDLSVSVECAELATTIIQRDTWKHSAAWGPGSNKSPTHENVVYTETLLTRTNRPLSAGELLEFPHVGLAIPPDAPSSFKLAHHELRWRLRLELKLKGDKRTFVQLIPFQVQAPRPKRQTTAPRYQTLPVANSLPSEPAPWLRAAPPHEEERRGPLPSEDVRRQLEGRLEVLETAHAHYSALEEALQTPKWKLHLRPRLETLRDASRQEPALVEALERLHHRARSEGWAATEPALVLAHEVEELRSRVGALATRHLGRPEDGEAPLARQLDRLEGSVVQSLPAPLAPGEKLLCSGRFSPALSVPGLLLLLGFSFSHCAVVIGGAEAVPSDEAWWGTWLVLTALCFWLQYRRSGRFWLTESRLIWRPTRGDPLQVPLNEIRRPGNDFPYPKSVQVLLKDGHTLHLQFISRASHFAEQLMRQCQASHSREPPTDAE